MITEYNFAGLPEAIAADRRLIAALEKVEKDATAQAYIEEAERSEAAERRRYCLEIPRELLFLKTRDALWTRNAAGAYPQSPLDRGKYKSMDPRVGEDRIFHGRAACVTGNRRG